MAFGQALRRSLLRPLVTVLIIAGALIAGAVPAQAASYSSQTWSNGWNWGGYLGFSDLNAGSRTTSDWNKVSFSEWNDRYSHTIRVYDSSGSLRLNKYVANRTTLKADVYMRKGSFRLIYCTYITGGNLITDGCETLHLYNG